MKVIVGGPRLTPRFRLRGLKAAAQSRRLAASSNLPTVTALAVMGRREHDLRGGFHGN